MCGSLFGGGKQPQTLVSAPAATNVTQNMEDATAVAAQAENKRNKQYSLSKTKATPTFGLGSVADENISLTEALGRKG